MPDILREDTKTVVSGASAEQAEGRAPLPAWIKVTAIAAASVLGGGLAAAWIYRKSVSRLQNAVETPENSNFSISGAGKGDED
jgi:hypothetical protein